MSTGGGAVLQAAILEHISPSHGTTTFTILGHYSSGRGDFYRPDLKAEYFTCINIPSSKNLVSWCQPISKEAREWEWVVCPGRKGGQVCWWALVGWAAEGLWGKAPHLALHSMARTCTEGMCTDLFLQATLMKSMFILKCLNCRKGRDVSWMESWESYELKCEFQFIIEAFQMQHAC